MEETLLEWSHLNENLPLYALSLATAEKVVDNLQNFAGQKTHQMGIGSKD